MDKKICKYLILVFSFYLSINLISDTFCYPVNNEYTGRATYVPFEGTFQSIAHIGRNGMDDMLLGGYNHKGGACHRETQFGYLPSTNPTLDCFKVGYSYDDFMNVGDFPPYGMAVDLSYYPNFANGTSSDTAYFYDFETALPADVKIDFDFAFQFNCDKYPTACSAYMNWFANFPVGNYIAFYDREGNIIDSGYSKYNPVVMDIISNDIAFTYNYVDGNNYPYVSNLGTRILHLTVEVPPGVYRIALLSHDGSNSKNMDFASDLINVFYPKITVDMSAYEIKEYKMQNMNFLLTDLPQTGSVYFRQCYKKQFGNISNITLSPLDTNGAFYYWNGDTQNFRYEGMAPIGYDRVQTTFPDFPDAYYVKYDLQDKYKGLIFLSVYSVGQKIENQDQAICIANGWWDKMKCGVRSTLNKVMGFLTKGSLGTSKYDEDFLDAEDYYCEFYVPADIHSSELVPNYDKDYNINSYDFDYVDENGKIISADDAFAAHFESLQLKKDFLTPFKDNFEIITYDINYSYNHLDLNLQHFLIAFFTIFIFVIVGRRFFH